MDIKTLVRREILGQEGYRAHIPDCRIKMDANEHPFTLPSSVKRALFHEMKNVSMNRYPEAGAPQVRGRYAQYYGVDEDMLMIGNGSDELIHILCSAVVSPSVVMVPVPTFVMYRIIAVNAGHSVTEVPLDPSFDLDLGMMHKEMETRKPVLVFFSYPNSPTGNCFSEEKVAAIIRESRGIVVVDEAYGIFSGKTLLPLVKRYDNLVVLKTLSKVGFAAMRIGFLIGNPALVRELDKVRLPYNVNALSQIAARFYLDHNDVFLRQTDEVIQRREELLRGLRRIRGVRPYPSESNFIFFSCDFDSDRIYSSLIREGILVKNLNGPGILKNCMRVTVGSRRENREFLRTLRNIVSV